MKTLKLLGKVRNLSLVFLLFSMVSCVTISPFDQHAFVQATSAKVDALNVMDLAKDDFASHQQEVKSLETQLQKIYEYEKNRPKNEITLNLWDKLLAKDGHLLGGFLTRWKSSGKLGETFIGESKKQVGEAFDIIAGLESKKIKPSSLSTN